MSLDATDIKLLTLLQRNAQMTAQELGQSLNLSASQAGRRRQQLESAGYVNAYVARLDAKRMGLSVQGFIQIHLSRHRPETSEGFARLIKTRPEITAAWSMTGDADYLLRVYCKDLEALNRLIQDELLPNEAVGKVHSQIVMEQLKDDSALPI